MGDKLPTFGVNSPTSTPTRPKYIANQAAVPTVDDDAVERAARAMWNSDPRRSMSATWDEVVDDDPDYELKDSYRSQGRAALTAAAPGAGLDADRVIRKLGSLQGQMIEIKSNINALQVETERLEDYMRNAAAKAEERAKRR